MRLRSLGLIGILALGLLAAPLAAEAQQPEKVPRIGYLSWAGPGLRQVLADAFLQGLREGGNQLCYPTRS